MGIGFPDFIKDAARGVANDAKNGVDRAKDHFSNAVSNAKKAGGHTVDAAKHSLDASKHGLRGAKDLLSRDFSGTAGEFNDALGSAAHAAGSATHAAGNVATAIGEEREGYGAIISGFGGPGSAELGGVLSGVGHIPVAGGHVFHAIGDALEGHPQDVMSELKQGGMEAAGGVLVTGLGKVRSSFGDEVAKFAADKLLQGGDNLPVVGKNRVNTDSERSLVGQWVDGNGRTIDGSSRIGQELFAGARDYPAVREAGQAIADGRNINDIKNISGGERVTLPGGQQGYKAVVSFYDSPGKGETNNLDGSLGSATVYFDASGKMVGLYDHYDFSNDNPQAHISRDIGDVVSARDFDISVGRVAEG